jgi:hypothetical protein
MSILQFGRKSTMTSQIHHTCDPEEAHAISDQVERILHSRQFNGSELLRNLLGYLTKQAIERPGEGVKEYDLAVDVLGRDRNFDSRLDSAVRVHSARLRAKLAEYYMAEGASDPLVIEVPKGSYLVTWRTRASHANPPPKIEIPASYPSPKRRFAWKEFGAGAAGAALLSGLIWFAFTPAEFHPHPAIQTFWRSFLGAAPDPIVVFSNHRFVGTSSTGLRVYREGVDSSADVNETYSGTGTVMGVQEIGDLFSRFRRSIRLKRAELLTWDEAQTTNLILVGSPESNSRLRQIPPLQYFDFKSSRAEPRLGVGGIVNVHPRPGEEFVYYGSGNPYTSDYAVIAMLPGLKPEYRILVLAGTNTYGLQAAAEFVCRPDLVNKLLTLLNVRSRDRVPDFEALVEVKISGGVPVHTNLVMARKRGS